MTRGTAAKARQEAALAVLGLRRTLGDDGLAEAFIAAMMVEDQDAGLRSAAVRMRLTYGRKPAAAKRRAERGTRRASDG